MKRIALLAIALAASVASAQAAPTYTAKISWTAPTTFTDGSAIGSKPITYRVASGSTSQPATSALTATWANATPGQCYTVVAIVDNVESAPASNCIGKAPNAPGGMTISVTVTVTTP